MPDFSMCTNPDCPMSSTCRRHENSGTKPSEHQSYLDFHWFFDETIGKENCIHYFDRTAYAIEELQKKLAKLEVNLLYMETAAKNDSHKIEQLEHQLKFECDTYLWERKLMSRRIALLQYWMERLFKYGSSPEARRNELTMTTEIPDSLIREGEDILSHLEGISDLEKVDGII